MRGGTVGNASPQIDADRSGIVVGLGIWADIDMRDLALIAMPEDTLTEIGAVVGSPAFYSRGTKRWLPRRDTPGFMG